MISVIIADDHRMFRQGLASLLADEADIELLGEADRGGEALRLIRELKPQVAVLDLSMPRPDGLEIVRTIQAEGLETSSLILTMYDDAATMRLAMDAGARGYLVKSGAFDEFVAAIRLIATGRSYFNAAFAPDPDPARPDLQLTARELFILSLVAQGLSSKSIADQLGISQRTVENHRQNIMNKLNIRSATALVGYAAKHRLL
jgi:DNA-binding NarL/FixJ family response regulator